MGRSADLPRRSGRTDGDDSGCSILHVDMDAFFASVEIRRRPELRGKPVIVGGGKRGVVCAASYAARRYGISSAMPMTTALRQCPHAVVLPVDHGTYASVSAAVMVILRSVTPLVEPLSLDEAFLDVSGVRRLLGRPADIARRIRARVAEEQQLTCSVGIAPTKFVAKVASARCKPDGMLVVPADGVLDFLHPLPVTALWGVGPSTAQRLQRLGLRTVGDVAQTPVDVLGRAVGAGSAGQLSALAQGLDPRHVQTAHVEKSISADRTFSADVTTVADAERELLRLSEEVSRRVRARGLQARTIGIKVRFADFRTISRVRTLPDPVDSTAAMHAGCVGLLRSFGLDRPRIRLLGVKAEGLLEAESASRQLSFDDALSAVPVVPTARTPRFASAVDRGATEAVPVRAIDGSSLDRVADAARRRFGPGAVHRASLLAPSTGVNTSKQTSSSSHDTESSPAEQETVTSIGSGFRHEDSARMLDS